MTTASPLRVLAVARSSELRDELSAALATTDGTAAGPAVEFRLGRLTELAGSLPRFADADVLLLDVDVDDPDEMRALDRVRAEAGRGHTPVVVTSGALTASGVRRLLRDGVADVIPQPVVRSELLDVLRTAAARSRQGRGAAGAAAASGRILTFSRASGGVGASTLAVSVAHALARRKGRRDQRPARVGLLDLDVQFGALALYLDVEPTRSLLEIIRDPERLDRALFVDSLVEHGSGLRVLTAPAVPPPLEALRPEVVAQLLQFARAEFDYTIVDMPLALASWTETVLTRSDLVFLTTQLNVPAVRQLRRLLDGLQEEGLYNLPTRLVLNRDEGGLLWRGAGVRRRQAERALGRRFDLRIPNDYPLVVDAANQGRSVFELKARSAFCRGVVAMVEAAVEELASPAAAAPVPGAVAAE